MNQRPGVSVIELV